MWDFETYPFAKAVHILGETYASAMGKKRAPPIRARQSDGLLIIEQVLNAGLRRLTGIIRDDLTFVVGTRTLPLLDALLAQELPSRQLLVAHQYSNGLLM